MVGILLSFGVGLAAGILGTVISVKRGWIDVTKVPGL